MKDLFSRLCSYVGLIRQDTLRPYETSVLASEESSAKGSACNIEATEEQSFARPTCEEVCHAVVTATGAMRTEHRCGALYSSSLVPQAANNG